MKYMFTFEYVPEKKRVVADHLSRSRRNHQENEIIANSIVHGYTQLALSESRKKLFEEETQKDKDLIDVIRCCEEEWSKLEKVSL